MTTLSTSAKIAYFTNKMHNALELGMMWDADLYAGIIKRIEDKAFRYACEAQAEALRANDCDILADMVSI